VQIITKILGLINDYFDGSYNPISSITHSTIQFFKSLIHLVEKYSSFDEDWFPSMDSLDENITFYEFLEPILKSLNNELEVLNNSIKFKIEFSIALKTKEEFFMATLLGISSILWRKLKPIIDKLYVKHQNRMEKLVEEYFLVIKNKTTLPEKLLSTSFIRDDIYQIGKLFEYYNRVIFRKIFFYRDLYEISLLKFIKV